MRMTKELLENLVGNSQQYDPMMEYVDWKESYVKEEYSSKDLKLYWYTSLTDMRAIEKMIYAEGLILMYHDKLTYEWLETACLKIMLDKCKDSLLDMLDIDNIKETIHNTYDYIMENKDEILRADKSWRPETRYRIKETRLKQDDSTNTFKRVKIMHKKKLTEDEFISLLDECKAKTGHRTYKSCLQYFEDKTGLHKDTFKNYMKRYSIVLDEKEDKSGRPKKSLLDIQEEWEVMEENWKLPVDELYKLVCNNIAGKNKMIEMENKRTTSKKAMKKLVKTPCKKSVANWKKTAMQYYGLDEETVAMPTNDKKKSIPEMRMDFDSHQIEGLEDNIISILQPTSLFTNGNPLL